VTTDLPALVALKMRTARVSGMFTFSTNGSLSGSGSDQHLCNQWQDATAGAERSGVFFIYFVNTN